MTRIDIINNLIRVYNLQTYLEIGVSYGDSLIGCRAISKLGVDPSSNYRESIPILKMTSDEFFNSLNSTAKFDLIFIDGLHTAEQVKRDIFNSLLHIQPYGAIVVHDCNPPTEYHSRSLEDFIVTGGDWNGDVYKGYIEAVKELGVSYFTVDTDWGVGVIKPVYKYPPIKHITLDWETFDQNRKELLNLIEPESLKYNL